MILKSRGNLLLDARAATPHFPGIGRYVVNLARAMSDMLPASIDLTLLLPETPIPPLDLSSQSHPHLHTITSSASFFSFRQQWEIPGIMKRLNTDLYHSPYFIMPYGSSSRNVVTIHDVIPYLFPRGTGMKSRLLFSVLLRLAIKRAIHIITVSQTTKRDLVRLFGIPSQKITVTPLAADPLFQVQSENASLKVLKRLGLVKPYLLYVGSNTPHKNLANLVKAWQQLELKSTQLVIAGKWDPAYPIPEKDAGNRQMRDAVRFSGPLPDTDLAALYTCAKGFVFPSRYEGFGLPVLEAMACGAPVACAATPCSREVAGDAALFFDPDNLESIALTLKRFLSDNGLRSDLRAKGLERARQFSWEKTARLTLDVYQRILRQTDTVSP